MRRNVKATKSFGHSGEQLRLWDQLVVDPGHALKAAMSEAIRSCDRSREEIVEEMNRLASLAGMVNGKTQAVTAPILDNPQALAAVDARLFTGKCLRYGPRKQKGPSRVG